MDKLQYLLQSIAACAALCFRRYTSMGSSSPRDGVPERVPQPEAHLQAPHRSHPRPALRLRRFQLGEQLVQPIYVWKLDVIQQGFNQMEIQDAEGNSSVYGRGGVLCGIDGGKRDSVSLQAPRAYGVRPNVAHTGLRRQQSQHGVHRVG